MEQLASDVGAMLREVFASGDPLGFLKPDVWMQALNKPGVFAAALVVLNLIVFTETGLFFGFLLPGDSLLVVVGLVASLSPEWSLPALMGTLCASAILGDTVGYWIGAKAGPAVFNRPDGRIFKQKYLLAAQEFYARHGGKTIIYARFVPFVRTFAPVVAGASRMDYKRFLMFNVVGGVAWVSSMLLFGYYLIEIVNPLLRPLFGPQFTIAKHVDLLALTIIGISIAPIAWKAVKSYLARPKGDAPPVVA